MLAGLTFIYNDIHRYGMIHFFARLLLFPACVLRACASLILAVESCGYLWLSKMGPKITPIILLEVDIPGIVRIEHLVHIHSTPWCFLPFSLQCFSGWWFQPH